MNGLTFEETNLLCIYNAGTRAGTMITLEEMRTELAEDETELIAMTETLLAKLRIMTDAAFETLELFPDFDE